MRYSRIERLLESILSNQDELLGKVEGMAIDQAQFDTDLAGLVNAVAALVTAVDALLVNKPAADFTAEDTAVQNAAAALNAELVKVTPTPAPTPAPPPPA